MAEGGWIGIAIPERYGGGGQGIRQAAAVLEEVAASGACMNGASAIHLSIFGMHPVVLHGTEEMRQRFLPSVADGSLHVAFGVTEPDAGTDTTKITTRAVRDGDHYVINGRKVWTTKALIADRILLLTRTTPLAECAKPTDGMTLFLVDRHAPGVDGRRPSPRWAATRSPRARRSTTTCSCRSSRPRRRGGPRLPVPARRAQRRAHPDRRRGARASGWPRCAGRCSYANERVVFGRPIGKNQGIAFPLAEAYAKLRAAALMIREAAGCIDAGLPCGEEANMAKYLAAEAGFFTADRAVQTHGGYRLRHRVPRRALLPRGPAAPHRPDQPGADPVVHRRARPRPAPQPLIRRCPGYPEGV